MIFIENETSFPLPCSFNENQTVSWLEECLNKFQITENQIVITFLNDEQLLNVNKHIFNRDYLTDTISLSYKEENKISGEIYISLERVYENSQNFDVTYLNELLRVIVHSFLHVIGYADDTPEQKERMHCLENLCLQYYS